MKRLVLLIRIKELFNVLKNTIMLINLKTPILLALLIFCFMHLNAQDGNFLAPEIFTPPSPEASAMFQLQEIPVNLNNGMVNNNIPIYVISVDNLRIPISIGYHSRGIKVEDVASRVGLGWSLNFGGIISRQVRGLPDDGSYGYLRTNYFTDFFTNEEKRQALLDADIDGIADFYPDKFFYSITDKGGSFIFNQHDKDNLLLQSFNDIRIYPVYKNTSHQSKIFGWQVVDDNGNEYFFGVNSRSSDPDENEIVVEDENILNNYSFKDGELHEEYIPNPQPFTSWNLTEIITPFGDTVSFEYESESIKYLRRSYDLATSEGVECYFSKVEIRQQQIKKISFNGGSVNFIQGDDRDDVDGGGVLDKIEIRDNYDNLIKQFKFYYSYTTSTLTTNSIGNSVGSGFNSDKRLFLDSIKQFDEVRNPHKPYIFSYSDIILPDRFSTAQDGWGFFNGKNNGDFLTFFSTETNTIDRTVDTVKAEAGLLKSIIFPSGGSAHFEYEHNKGKPPDYFDEVLLNPLNPLENFSFGDMIYSEEDKKYYGNFTIGTNKAGSLNYTATISGEDCGETEHGDGCDYEIKLTLMDDYNQSWDLLTGTNTINKTIDGDYLVEAIPLDPDNYTGSNYINPDSLIDPGDPENDTNGTYFYLFFTWKEYVANQEVLLYGPGKRIKKIVYKDSDETAKIKTYEYKDDQSNSSGIFFGLPNYYHIVDEVNGNPIIDRKVAKTGYSFASSHSEIISYSEVIEYFGGLQKNHGKTKYHFSVCPDAGEFYKYPYYIPNDRGWLRGMNLITKFYENTLNGYSLVKRVNNIYNQALNENDLIYPPDGPDIEYYSLNDSLYSLALARFKIIENTDGSIDYGCNYYETFYLTGGRVDLIKTKETEYFNNDSLIKHIYYNYDYETAYQLKHQKSKVDNEKTIITKFYYPPDLLDSEDDPFMGVLNDLNRVSKPVIVETYVDTDDVLSLISKEKIKYNNFNGIIQLHEYHTAKGNNPMHEKLRVDQYHEAKPIQVNRFDSPVTSYIYGYNNMYVVAKIEGLEYDDIPTDIVDEIKSSSDNQDEEQLMLALNALRNHDNLSNAMVTTYLYKPLVGVTSITDPREETIFYEYDDFGRFLRARDKDGYVIEEYEHHYAD